MAKPGSDDARRLQRGAVDLAQRGMSDEQAAKVQEQLELGAGMRCRGCGRRIGIGFHFTSIDPREPGNEVLKLAACSREDCDFAERARDGGTCMELVEYAWLDPAGVDARPAELIVRQNERRANGASPAS